MGIMGKPQRCNKCHRTAAEHKPIGPCPGGVLMRIPDEMLKLEPKNEPPLRKS